MPPNSINEMVSGSCVFLTGVTGFVGGCLLERICQLDPGPERVFVLVREKRGVDPHSRLQKMFSSPLFSKTPKKNLERVHVLEGDMGNNNKNLGLSEADQQLIISHCTHVFHVAACISFVAPLDLAVRINLRGTWAILQLAKQMKKLRAMVHVSTAYANCTRDSDHAEFQEQIYHEDVDPVEVICALKKMSLDEIETKYAKLIGKYPNTYTLAKRLAENLLAQDGRGLPLSIVRPGIILNTWREPFPGWLDSVNSGACGFIAGAAKGIFCTFQARADMVMDVSPVDLVVSTILAAALKAEREPRPRRAHVFHCTSGSVNPTTWAAYCDSVIRASRQYPCARVAWYPRMRLTRCFLRHRVLEIQRRYIKGSTQASYFSLREWEFTRNAADELIEMLPEEERKKHPMDPRLIDWEVYFKNCVIGTRTYFHKESAESLPKARRTIAFLRVIAALAPLLSFFGLSCAFVLLAGLVWTTAASVSAILVLTLVCL
ncbi:putative fatty acyl-CoA reductase CG5065 isoform X2 [Phymastichus coffea]|uniref:putative fatty acyl-CoA reductase CG5065 isoform X2 n=1 Tax=Phymastichus coffea TaxID=108790 RepID=UPI00273C2274|nr:putative fatty acyl-CoA reductase CG5065 isoform X2 [Phymastichus coffea]